MPSFGSIIATRRPDNWLGWLFCADGLLISFQNFAGTYAAFHGTASSPGTLPGAVWFSLLDDALWIPFLFMTTAFLFLLFPEGRPASRGRKNAVLVASVAAVTATVVAGLFEPTLYSYPDVANPSGIRLPSVASGLLTGASFLVLLAVLVYAVVNLFRRLPDACSISRDENAAVRGGRVNRVAARSNSQPGHSAGYRLTLAAARLAIHDHERPERHPGAWGETGGHREGVRTRQLDQRQTIRGLAICLSPT